MENKKNIMIAARVDEETKNKVEEVRKKLGERSLNAVLLLGLDKLIKEVLPSQENKVASA